MYTFAIFSDNAHKFRQRAISHGVHIITYTTVSIPTIKPETKTSRHQHVSLMVSTRQNHRDFCYHIQDIVDNLLHNATHREIWQIGRLIRLFEIRDIIPQLTIPFRLQSHHYTALPFLFKMNNQNTIDLALLPIP